MVGLLSTTSFPTFFGLRMGSTSRLVFLDLSFTRSGAFKLEDGPEPLINAATCSNLAVRRN